MASLDMITLTGSALTLDRDALTTLQAGLRGRLIYSGDPDYDQARTIWNAHIDRRPAVIAQCVGVADVVEVVRFAHTHQLLTSVRGGGHNFPGMSMCQDGLVIDLSLMTSVRVDPHRCTARAEGGAKWGHFDRETQAFGLATTGGTDSDTGIGGLTLGGGIGWLGGTYGLACDNLLSVDVVTADGVVRTANAEREPDLFWAVRGGCGNFGVVTSFEYQLYPVGELLAGLIVYPFERAPEVLKVYRDFASTAPDELNTACAFRILPDGRRVVGIGVCYNGSPAAANRLFQPLQALDPVFNTVQPLSYTQVQHMLDGVTPAGNRYYGKSHLMADIADDAIAILIDYFAQVTSPLSVLVFQQLGNAANRVAPEATAFAHRDARYNLNLIAQWTESHDVAHHIQWTRSLWDALVPYATGGIYLPNVGGEAEEGASVIQAAFGLTYDRLVALKARYDPANLFQHNQNIKPKQASGITV